MFGNTFKQKKETLMRSPRLFSITSSAILLSALCSSAFAWSINGVVKSKISGRLLGGVKISTFNIGGYETVSAEDGTFSLSGEGTDALADIRASKMAIHMEGNMLTIYNADAQILNVSIIDAMGKVLKQNNVGQVQGIVSLDLGKLARGTKFVRINADRNNSTFMVTDKGVTALKKEGDMLDFGGLLGRGPVMELSRLSPSKMIARGGRIPAPMQSLKN